MFIAELAPTDLLRRSTPTPLHRDVRIEGSTVRVETNSAAVLERMQAALEGQEETPSGQPEFLWRLVVEPDSGSGIDWHPLTAFSDGELFLANIGQRNFIAVDLKARQTIAFVEERFANDEQLFERLFLATLLRTTKPCLRSPNPPLTDL